MLSCVYARRSKKFKWLETHLWHAKRMKMINYFNYRIANNPCDKSERACYRFAKNENVLYDMSYYFIFQLEGNIMNLKNAFKTFIQNDIEKMFKKEFFSGNRSGLSNIISILI